jgi:hypothetical protein
MKNNYNGMDKLLKWLRKHPQSVKQIVFNPEYIKKKLGSKVARRLLEGVDASDYVDYEKFLAYLGLPDDGYPIAHCSSETVGLCAKGTRLALRCGGGTQPTIGRGRTRKKR